MGKRKRFVRIAAIAMAVLIAFSAIAVAFTSFASATEIAPDSTITVVMDKPNNYSKEYVLEKAKKHIESMHPEYNDAELKYTGGLERQLDNNTMGAYLVDVLVDGKIIFQINIVESSGDFQAYDTYGQDTYYVVKENGTMENIATGEKSPIGNLDNKTETTTQVTEPLTENIIPTEEITEPVVDETTESTAKPELKSEYKITFSIFDLTTNADVTVYAKCGDKKYELVFTKENNYVLTEELPLGTYEITIDLGIDSFVVGADDLQNYSVNAKEEKHEFMRLVSRNWIFVLLLLILGVAYFRIQRQKSR